MSRGRHRQREGPDFYFEKSECDCPFLRDYKERLSRMEFIGWGKPVKLETTSWHYYTAPCFNNEEDYQAWLKSETAQRIKLKDQRIKDAKARAKLYFKRWLWQNARELTKQAALILIVIAVVALPCWYFGITGQAYKNTFGIDGMFGPHRYGPDEKEGTADDLTEQEKKDHYGWQPPYKRD